MESLFFQEVVNTDDPAAISKCFKIFRKPENQYLTEKDFDALTRTLLTDADGGVNEISVKMAADLFITFDQDNRKIYWHRFENLWKNWIKPLLNPVTALLIIDVQNDFIDGTLALKNCPAKQDGADVIPIINNLLSNVKFDFVAYSIDYHPPNHVSFIENVNKRKIANSSKISADEAKAYDVVTFEGPPLMQQKLWPHHCVMNTWGSELDKKLKVAENATLIFKGSNSEVDSYSAFWDNMKVSETSLNEQLKENHVTHVFVCGLAFDYCVGYTALDALELGYATTVITDATSGTDESHMRDMQMRLASSLCVMANSDEIQNLVSGQNRKTEFAYVLGKTFKKNTIKDMA